MSPPLSPMPASRPLPRRPPRSACASRATRRRGHGSTPPASQTTRAGPYERGFPDKTTPRTGCNSNPFGICLRDKLRLMEGIHTPCSCNVFSQRAPVRPSPCSSWRACCGACPRSRFSPPRTPRKTRRRPRSRPAPRRNPPTRRRTPPLNSPFPTRKRPNRKPKPRRSRRPRTRRKPKPRPKPRRRRKPRPRRRPRNGRGRKPRPRRPSCARKPKRPSSKTNPRPRTTPCGKRRSSRIRTS